MIQICVWNNKDRYLGSLKVLEKYCDHIEILELQCFPKIILYVEEENLPNILRTLNNRKHHHSLEFKILNQNNNEHQMVAK